MINFKVKNKNNFFTFQRMTIVDFFIIIINFYLNECKNSTN